MNLKEFEEKIELVEILISGNYGDYWCVCPLFYSGSICILNSRFARAIFVELFFPNIPGISKDYRYFGDSVPQNVPIRLTALYLFKEHCISLKLYKEF